MRRPPRWVHSLLSSSRASPKESHASIVQTPHGAGSGAVRARPRAQWTPPRPTEADQVIRRYVNIRAARPPLPRKVRSTRAEAHRLRLLGTLEAVVVRPTNYARTELGPFKLSGVPDGRTACVPTPPPAAWSRSPTGTSPVHRFDVVSSSAGPFSNNGGSTITVAGARRTRRHVHRAVHASSGRRVAQAAPHVVLRRDRAARAHRSAARPEPDRDRLLRLAAGRGPAALVRERVGHQQHAGESTSMTAPRTRSRSTCPPKGSRSSRRCRRASRPCAGAARAAC